MSKQLLMTPEGKKVLIDTNSDIILYDAPHNPPNTGTAYTSGTDLFIHRARSGTNYFYAYYWSMWEGEGSRRELVSEDQAKKFILEKSCGGIHDRKVLIY